MIRMIDEGRKEEENSTSRRASILGFDYKDLSSGPRPLFKDILTNEEIKKLRAVPINLDKNTLDIGITTITSKNNIEYLKQRFNDHVTRFYIISDASYRDYVNLYDPPKKIVYEEININSADAEKQISSVSKILEEVKASDMLAYLVQQAYKLVASDIHIESNSSGCAIRFRVDGVLHPVALINIDKYRILISAIASGANISTSSLEPQQGHISEKVTMADGTLVDVNVRVETVQTINSMDVVMRIFHMDMSMYTLDKLGLNTEQRKVVDAIIAKPSGLVMVVGPTGSGKTTTLYSMLNTLKSSERKIITIEDPVEYQFPGITQIPVRTSEGVEDISFNDKLKAILRLDPDVVMVGEIRDLDTARTALQASLTGHLVLTTFHAGSASAALTRLADVIGKNPLFISAIRLIMAQRLIRKLDDTIKVQYQASEQEKEYLSKIIETFPENVQKPDISNLNLYKAGTSEENPFGYKGQIAIREQLTMNDAIRSVLENSDKIVSTDEIQKVAMKSGMLTMSQEAVQYVISGQTSMEELYRTLD
jgi:type II secretory ATPase GspE/PulE/Tfp pilus assembly ATPase PilB-like protein